MLFYPPPRGMVFGRRRNFVNKLSSLAGLYFYGLAALDRSLGCSEYDKWWNLPICGF
jgi:hypothetical protein